MFAVGTRVELSHIESVDTYIKHSRVIVENTCRSITYMYIPIENDNLLCAIFLLGNSCGYGSIVIKTETASGVSMGVVPWWSYDCKCAVYETTTY